MDNIGFIIGIVFGIITFLVGIYMILLKRKNYKKYIFTKTTGVIVHNDFKINSNFNEDECCFFPEIEYYVNQKKYNSFLRNPFDIKTNYNNSRPFKLNKNIEIMYSKTDPSIIVLSKTYDGLIVIAASILWMLISFLVFNEYFNILKYIFILFGIISLVLLAIPEFKAHSKKYIKTNGILSKLLSYNDYLHDFYTYRKIISFNVDDKKYYYLSVAATNPIFKKKKYIIKYNPDNPYDCVLKYEIARVIGIIVLIGLITILLTI